MSASVACSSFATVPGGHRGCTVPLSYQQATYLDAERAHAVGYRIPASSRFVTNTFAGVRIHGELDDAVVHRTVEEMLLRHDSLRTRFDRPGTDALQIVTARTTGAIESVDLSVVPEPARERAVAAVAAEIALQPIDRECGLLLRVSVIRISSVEHVLVFVVPHIVSDSVSMQIVLRDFVTLYLHHAGGLTPPPANTPVHYADFVLWQQQWVSGDASAGIRDYVERRLAGARAVELPADPDAPAEQAASDGAQCAFSIGGDLCGAITELSVARKVTPFVILLSAYAVLLSRWSDARDLCLVAPLAGRPDANSYNVVGLFSNPCPLRLDVSGDPPFASLLERVDAAVAEAIRHRIVPFRVLADIARHRGTPLPAFGAGVNSVPEGSSVLPRRYAGLLGRVQRIDPYVVNPELAGAARQVRSDLNAWFGFSDSDISLRLIYRRGHFHARTIARAARDFRAVLASLAIDPQRRLSTPRLRLDRPQPSRSRRPRAAAAMAH